MSTTNMPSTNITTRQPMCSGGKIQLPKINVSINNVSGLSYLNPESNKNIVTMNSAISSDDLCYNRCPNGEAPQVDKMSGNYFCLVPSLVTYQIQQNPKEPTVTNNSDGTETTIQKGDEIDYTKSYTVSCQSTDITDFSNPQGDITKNTNNTMFGTPILIASGLYEHPLGPNEIRSFDYVANADYKWFCKRPMYGAPPLGRLQSPYEAINKDIMEASADVPVECQSAVINSSLSMINQPKGAADDKKQKCKPTLTQKAAIGISNGVPMVQEQKTPIPIAAPLTIVPNNYSDGITVPNTITKTDASTGAVTSMGGLIGASAAWGIGSIGGSVNHSTTIDPPPYTGAVAGFGKSYS